MSDTETIAVETKGTPLTNLEHEKFCQFYVKNDQLRSNATHCYAEAYNYNLDELSKDDAVWSFTFDEEGKKTGREMIEKSTYDKAYNTCSVNGHKLLRQTKIQQRLNELLNEILTDDMVDTQLGKIIMQDKELGAKYQGIKIYNDMKGRIIKKTDITTDGEKIEGVVVLPAKE